MSFMRSRSEGKSLGYDIQKQSDRNHTTKGVKNLLYKIKENESNDPDRELNHESIEYLRYCFSCAIGRNEGNLVEMRAAIKNIPYHAYNVHDNCSNDWCRFEQNKENFEFRKVPGGFKNQILFGSTQRNESLNISIARKAPKGMSYGQSESYDFRVACTVSQKNQGEKYVQTVMSKCLLSPGTNTSKYCERMEKSAKIRDKKAKTPIFKLRRIELKKIDLN